MSRTSGRFTVLHLSDVHATESGLLYDAVDGVARLDRVAEYARAAGVTPEVVVITGDLIQRGNPGAYPAVRDACARLEEALGAPVLTVLGNHDDPVAAGQLKGHEQGHNRVVHAERFRFVLLDSHLGFLTPEQLAWLRDVLATPHGSGTIVAVHHAPLGSPMPVLQKQGLRNAHELMAVLASSDTRAVLSGHFHHALSATVRGIPVFVGPSLAYHQVMNAGPSSVSGHDTPMFSLVQFTDDGVSSSPVELSTRAPLFTAPIVLNNTPVESRS